MIHRFSREEQLIGAQGLQKLRVARAAVFGAGGVGGYTIEALARCGERVFLFVGPEGGFAPEEAELAQSLGGKLLSLGRRILRTETAPLAALSAIFYEKGDMEL